MMLMSQQNKSIQQQQHQMNMYYQQQQLQQQQQSEPHFDDQSLPPPPLQLLQDPSTVPANSYQMYGELTTLNNGSKMGKVSVQEVNVNRHSNQSTNERPVLPPPPIPDHHSHVSDLQQMQNQIIRKFGHINIDSEHGPSEAADLPPPPSLPDFTELNNGFGGNSVMKQNIVSVQMSEKIQTLSLAQQHNKPAAGHSDESDMPLPPPPPPIDLQDHHNQADHFPSPAPALTNRQTPSLPQQPPPPIPTNGNSNSNSSSSSNGGTPNVAQASKILTTTPSEDRTSRSFLDDINKGRFTLKPTQRDAILEDRRGKVSSSLDESSRDTLQPFVNNSDVAAIIDFVRKFRPHVSDSSEDDETSDWDD